MCAIRATGAIILMLSYGYTIKEHDDPYVDVVEAAVSGFSECLEPGAFLVDMIPLRESFFLPCSLLGMQTIYLLLFTNSAICA